MDTIQLIGFPDPVPIASIVWLEGEANYTRVHYQNGTFTLVTQPLHWFEQHLNFIRVHRSSIINPVYIHEFVQKRGRAGWVRLTDNRIVSVSRDRLESTALQIMLFNEMKSSFHIAQAQADHPQPSIGPAPTVSGRARPTLGWGGSQL